VEATEHRALPDETTTTPLHLTVDPMWDWMCALAFGRVADGWSRECRLVSDDAEVVFLLETPTGPVLGFEVFGWNAFEVPEEGAELWHGPRFDVPRLGLVQASAGEILTATRAHFGGDPTIDAQLFHQALAEPDLAQKLILWESCLDAGDMKAHFGWGCVLLQQAGRPREAYFHLRRYTEIAPDNAWAWSWRGQACLALGERREAIDCFLRALQAEPVCGMETDAGEQLGRLIGGGGLSGPAA
jgi:hypothetical protein